MRDRSICVFVSEEDCPKEHISLSCKECIKNDYHKIIEEALSDFVSLGDSFTDIFLLCNELIANNGAKVKVEIPLESIHKVNRVVNALFSTKEKNEGKEIIYRRLIYYFFEIIIDEFKEKEYREKESLH